MQAACHTPEDIHTPRLILRPMSGEFLDASICDDQERAAALLGLTPPQEWFAEKHLMALRRDDCRVDPAYAPWSLRAIGLRGRGKMVGYIGFHTRPDPPYLQEIAPGGVELGYTIVAAHRRQGYAAEAICGLAAWATGEHGVEKFVISVSPANTASAALAARLGFVRIGGHDDERDGYEDILLLHGDALRRVLSGARGGPGDR